MRQLPLSRSLLFFLDQLEYTEAALAADPEAATLATPFREEIQAWPSTFEKHRAARREVVRSHAVVAVRNEQLDNRTVDFSVALLAEVRGDRTTTGFRRFFPSAPSELIRRALRTQCQQTLTTIVPALEKLGDSNPLHRFGAVLGHAATAALAALDARAVARGSSASASLDVEEWKEGVNRLRLSTYGALLAVAADKKYPRTWAESFFPGAAAATADDAEDPELPAPAPNDPGPGVTPAPGSGSPR